METFMELLQNRWQRQCFTCIGLDPELDRIPKCVTDVGVTQVDRFAEFNLKIVHATQHVACAFKPNFAFYLAHGENGIRVLYETCEIIRRFAPGVPIIFDIKCADIGNSNRGYAKFAFDELGAHAITVHPTLGQESLQESFLSRKDKGIFVLARTSNPGADEFQHLFVPGANSLSELIAKRVETKWNANGNCGIVAGATNPDMIKIMREVAPTIPFLIPGIGQQAGDLQAAVSAGLDANRNGIIINASRSIIFASNGNDYAERAADEAQKLNAAINRVRH